MKLDFSHIPSAPSFVISAGLFVSDLRFAEGYKLVVQMCWGANSLHLSLIQNLMALSFVVPQQFEF